MNRSAMVVLPLSALLLTACSWTFASKKADLQMAEQAAKIAGEDELAKRGAPQDLVPVKPTGVAKTKPTVIKPIVVGSSVAPAMPAATVAAPSAKKAPDAEQPAVAIAAPVLSAVKPLASDPAPVSQPPAQKADVATVVPVNGTAIHLASYREVGSAQRGWRILTKSYHALLPLKPLYVSVDIPGKGRMLRLYGTGAEADVLKTICNQLKAEGAYCAANIAF